MPNVTTKFSNDQRLVLEAEVDLSAAAAVSTTRGRGVTCTKSSTATYTFVFKGNTHGSKMYAVLSRWAGVSGVPTSITGANITSITQATDGTDDITVVVKTTNATWVETAVTGATTLSLEVVIQTNRMTMPLE